MASRIPTSTERLYRLLALAAVIVAGLPAAAHDVPRTAVRELVRLQGYVAEAGAASSGDTVELSVLGKSRTFRIHDRQVFIAVGAAGRPTEKEAQRIVVQGARELLAKIAGAGPDQRVTLLGERRPGSPEIFVAAVDLCPESSAP